MNTIRTPLRSIVAAALTATALSAAEEWKQFPIWGGGNLQSVEISASSPNVWYTYADVDGPYRSDDAGKNWVPLHGNFNAMQRRRGLAQIRGLSVDPRNPDSFVTVSGSTWVTRLSIGLSFFLRLRALPAGHEPRLGQPGLPKQLPVS